MKNFEYKEEYIILTQKQKRKINNFNSSIKNKLYNIRTKTLLLIILFFSLIATIFLSNITTKETYLSFGIGNISTYLTKEMVDKFNLYINTLNSESKNEGFRNNNSR